MSNSAGAADRVKPTEGYGAELDRAVWDRIRLAMNHQEPDRVPIWDYIDNRHVVEHFARGDDDYHATMVRAYHELGIDLCRGYGGSFAEEREGEASTSHKISGRTSWVTRYAIQTVEELRAYRYEPPTVESLRTSWTAGIRAQQQRFAPKTMYVPGGGCGFHAVYGLMSQERFSYWIYDEPQELDRLLELFGEGGRRCAQVAAEEQLGPIYFIGDDIAYKAGLLFSPEFLRRTFIPLLRQCVDESHAGGIKVVYHSDGNLWGIMDDLVDAGIDGINPIEPIAEMTIERLRKRYGHDLLLVGGIDCSQLLPLGTPDDIRREVRHSMRVGAPGGGLFIGSSSEIVPATPLANILAFYEACHEHGAYPIRTA